MLRIAFPQHFQPVEGEFVRFLFMDRRVVCCVHGFGSHLLLQFIGPGVQKSVLRKEEAEYQKAFALYMVKIAGDDKAISE